VKPGVERPIEEAQGGTQEEKAIQYENLEQGTLFGYFTPS